MEWRDQLSRVFIHNDLVEELKIRKEDCEKELGYKLEGGVPIVSKICAEILKRQRTGKCGKNEKIVVEFQKIKGKKKNSMTII